MNELALFAGAGGGILGGQLLGWRTVCAVEYAAYPRRFLLARQRDGMLPRFAAHQSQKLPLGIKSWGGFSGSDGIEEVVARFCRVAYGVADRVDRIKATGNGQVLRVAATAWRILTRTIA